MGMVGSQIAGLESLHGFHNWHLFMGSLAMSLILIFSIIKKNEIKTSDERIVMAMMMIIFLNKLILI